MLHSYKGQGCRIDKEVKDDFDAGEEQMRFRRGQGHLNGVYGGYGRK